MRTLIYSFLIFLWLPACQNAPGSAEAPRWYKGNLHTHSFWSDGDDFPEMIMDWYRNNGYQFIALSDHNIFQQGEKWIAIPDSSLREQALTRYRARFGADWVETRQDTAGLQARLKTLAEYRSFFEVPDTFLIVRSEEVSDRYEDKPIHLNVTNMQELIQPQGGNSVVEVMQNNINAVLEQRKRTGQPMFLHLNHPNFYWAVTAQDMMALENERFFEVYNGHPMVNNYGDSLRSSTEEMWDEINAVYLDMGKPLLYGLAVDDSHNYHEQGPSKSNTGRGWVMVQADALTPAAIIEAMEAGKFYASTGVSLEDIGLEDRTYTVRIAAEEGVEYTIQFWGVKKDGDRGELLAETTGSEAAYTLTGAERLIRAKVISSTLQPNPFREGDREKAWTQPVRVE